MVCPLYYGDVPITLPLLGYLDSDFFQKLAAFATCFARFYENF